MENKKKQQPDNEKPKLYSKKEIVERARSQIGSTDYAIFENNGEKNYEGQSRWTKTGKAESKQVTNAKDGIASVLATGIATAVGGPVLGTLALVANLDEKSKKQPKVVRVKSKPKVKSK